MKTASAAFFSIVSALVLLGCENSSLVSGDAGSLVDTLSYQVTSGIVLSLDGFKDTYTLDDSLIATLRLRNITDPTPLPLAFYGSPPHSISIYPVGSDDPIFFYPQAIGFADWTDTLRLGDSLTYYCLWSQNTWDSKAITWTDLKAFAGVYKIVVHLAGSPLLKGYLTKFVTISSDGNPLSAWARVDYKSTDSVRVDFIVRNRINSSSPFLPVGPSPMEVFFVHRSDTLVSLTYPLAYSAQSLAPLSDNNVFRFAVSKTDTTFSSLNGAFDMRFVIHLQQGDLNASAFNFLR